VAGDLFVFSVFFTVFVHERGRDPAGYGAARDHLNLGIGTFDTLALLIGSILVVFGVDAVRRGLAGPAGRLFAAAMSYGLLFAAAKVTEWVLLARNGHTPRTQDFYMYYFVLTGIHLAHLTVATGMLALARRIAARRVIAARDVQVIESIGIFWHLVDLLWMVLFALLYLMR